MGQELVAVFLHAVISDEGLSFRGNRPGQKQVGAPECIGAYLQEQSLESNALLIRYVSRSGQEHKTPIVRIACETQANPLGNPSSAVYRNQADQ